MGNKLTRGQMLVAGENFTEFLEHSWYFDEEFEKSALLSIIIVVIERWFLHEVWIKYLTIMLLKNAMFA